MCVCFKVYCLTFISLISIISSMCLFFAFYFYVLFQFRWNWKCEVCLCCISSVGVRRVTVFTIDFVIYFRFVFSILLIMFLFKVLRDCQFLNAVLIPYLLSSFCIFMASLGCKVLIRNCCCQSCCCHYWNFFLSNLDEVETYLLLLIFCFTFSTTVFFCLIYNTLFGKVVLWQDFFYFFQVVIIECFRR